MGLPEKSEGWDLLKYIQQKLPEWLNFTMDHPLKVEQAHRTL